VADSRRLRACLSLEIPVRAIPISNVAIRGNAAIASSHTEVFHDRCKDMDGMRDKVCAVVEGSFEFPVKSKRKSDSDR
jgi:hypothetical protein